VRVRRPRRALAILVLAACGRGDRLPTVGLVYFQPDPIVDRAVQGVKDGLRESGFREGEGYRLEVTSAQGDMGAIPATARSLVARDVDVIVSLTTPVLVGTVSAVRGSRVPVVFTMVYDPYVAGVAKSPTDHPANVTGVASPPPFGRILDLIRRVVPGARRVGVIYNDGEPNSVFSLEHTRREATRRGMVVVARTVTGAGEVQQAAQSLVGAADVIAIIGSNTVGSAIEAVVGVGSASRIPVITSNPVWHTRGAAVNLGPDYYHSGRAAGKLAARILRGESPAKIPIQQVTVPGLSLNLPAAAKQGAVIPPDLIDSAGAAVVR
jgi:putative tryptophan/tyrosine transport system substrate-binding protein